MDLFEGKNDKFDESFYKLVQDVQQTIKAVQEDDFNTAGCKKLIENEKQDKSCEHLEEILEKMENNAVDSDMAKRVGAYVVLTRILAILSRNKVLKRGAMLRRVTKPEEVPGTELRIRLYYIACPMAMFFMAFVFQSFMLHVATRLYVRYMDKGSEERRHDGGQLFDLVGQFIAAKYRESQGMSITSRSQGAVLEGSLPIPMKLLDLTAMVPLALCFMSYLFTFVLECGGGARLGWTAIKDKATFNIGLWNKTFLVASCMAVLKGVFDVVTILPDSIGWEACQARLEDGGLKQLRGFHFIHEFWPTLWDAILGEVVGGEGGRRVRYCADMMISGHTYFAALFALSAYHSIIETSRLVLGPERQVFARILRISVGAICIITIFVEMILVAASRFHYTVDMLASLVLVVLLWDSTHIEQAAADWSEGYRWRDPYHFEPKMSPLTSVWYWLRPKCTTPTDNDPLRHLLPSQSTCINFRMAHGVPPWATPDGDEEDPGEHLEMTQGATGENQSLLPTGR